MEQQILNRIKMLLDKPQSPHTTKQLQQLLTKTQISQQKCLATLCLKYRGDLLIFIIDKHILALPNLIKILTFIQENVLQFQKQDTKQIYALILSKAQFSFQNKDLFGYKNLINLGLNHPNLERKSIFFSLAMHNLQLFWNLGYIKLVRGCIKSFTTLFNKNIIYVASYVALMNSAFHLNENKPSFLNNNNEQEVVVNCIERFDKINLLNQFILILSNIKQKQCYQLQRQCLKGIYLLCQSHQNQTNNMQTFIHIILLHKINSLISVYLYFKPTREQARLVFAILAKIQTQLAHIHTNKMTKFHSKDKDHQIVLIQKVIEKTNQYRLNHQVEVVQKIQNKKNNASSFLKKGTGIGGSKFILEAGKRAVSPNSTTSKIQNHIEKMVDLCFSNQIERPYIENNLNKNLASNRQIQTEKSRNEFNTKNEEMKKDVFLCENEDRIRERSLQEDENFFQICNLIDLAYEYKFQANSRISSDFDHEY